MVEVINGYILRAPLTNEDAGFARWGRAEKGGRDYFIKEFLNPCYPTKDSPFDERTQEELRKTCSNYEAEKSLLYSKLNEVSDGNLVRVEEFFGWNGKYYITTQWIDAARCRPETGQRASDKMTVEDLHRLNREDVQMRCCLALSHAIMQLHSVSIVHADIKPRNIILTKLGARNISPKIIDVDSSFFASEPPAELVGDQVYLAPESVMFMIKRKDASSIGCAVDVFAMGLVFHQIFAGALPELPAGYNFACEACLDGKKPKISKKVPRSIRAIVSEMLEADARNRPAMADVHRELWKSLYGHDAGGWKGAETAKDSVPSGIGEEKDAGPSKETGSGVRFGSGINIKGAAAEVKVDSAEPKEAMKGHFHTPTGL